MPAVSILKKPFARRRSPPPPPPTAPPVAEPTKPAIPPKPKRGVVPHRPVEGVRFVDDDEPTTEESYDFKDIDFASEIFDFRVPPPRPRRPRSPPPPPLLLQNGSAVRLAGKAFEVTKVDRSVVAVVTGGAADDAPVIAVETGQSAVAAKTDMVSKEAPSTAMEAEPSAVAAQTDGTAVELPVTKEPSEEEEDDDDDELDEIKTDDLARFLAEHEGKELTLEDVRQLELLLDEVERKENGRDVELQKDVAADAEEEITSERVPAVRFGVAEIIEDGVGVVLEEDLQGAADVQDDHKTDADYSDVRFHGDALKRKKKKKTSEFGIYEPVGQPDLRRLRPDLSSYVAPMPSSNVGDPFSWRRRGKRRHDDYGYADQRRGRKAPAMDKILDGCAEVERLIVSRDLSPPGGLLDFLESSSLDRKNRKKKQKTTAECSSPTPPLSPVLQNDGPSLPLPELPEEAAAEEVDRLQVVGEVDEAVPSEPEPEMDSERMTELESQILTSDTYVESLITPIDAKKEMVVGSTADVEDVLETPMVKATAYETTADTFEMIDADFEDTVVPLVVEKAELSYELGPTVPRRLSRRDGRSLQFSSPPVRPYRRKRVASADPLLQSMAVSNADFATAPPPRSKPRRSASFHTAEEIRRKIDTQAQLFLRTPRRRDRTSPTYESTCPSASATLTYGRTLCRPRPPLTPVYSHVNKDAIARKKEAAAQTVDSSGSDVEKLPPLPPRDGVCSVESNLDDTSGDEQHKPEDLAVAESNVGVSPEPPLGVTPEPESSVEPEVREDGQGHCQPTTGKELEDSEVPTEFHSLAQTAPDGANAVEDLGTSLPPADDVMPLADGKDLSVQSRPLPPPPAPPRHRGHKNSQSIAGLSPDTPVVFCGIVPQKGEALTGKLTVVPEMKVLRLSVVQLDASLLRVAQIEADHVVAHRLDELHGSHGSASTPSPQPSPGSGSSQQPPPDSDGRQQPSCPSAKSLDCPNDDANQNVRSDEPPNDGLDINSNWEPWEPGYCDGRDSPLTGAASTTSGSASYVTCDETLHDDEDDAELTNAFDQCSVDGGFGFDEDATDGCPTPTELAMDDVIEPRPPELWDGPITSAAFSSPLSSLSSLSTFPSDTTLTAVDFSSPAPWRSTAAAADENCNLPAHLKPESVSHSESSTTEPCSVPSKVDLEPADPSEPPAAVDDGLAVAVGHELLELPPLPDSEGQSETGGFEPSTMEEEDGAEEAATRAVIYRTKWSRAGVVRRSVSHNDGVLQSPKVKRRPTDAKSQPLPPLRPPSKSTRFYVSSTPELTPPTTPTKTPPAPPPKPTVTIRIDEAPATENGGGSRDSGLPPSSDEDVDDSDDDDTDSVSLKSSVSHADDRPYCKAFYVAREMMTSERVFVDVLKLLTEDFPRALEEEEVTWGRRGHGQVVVPRDVLHHILDALPQLRQLNEVLLKDLEERIENWDEIGRIADIIVRHGPFLKLYADYIKKYPTLENALNEARKKYPLFAEAAHRFEMSDRCKNLKLHHYMLKPVQRIPQYRLLLQDYSKCIDESSADYESTQTALHIVSDVADHANETIKHAEKFEKLVEIQNRMSGGYQVIKPGRVFIKEGELSKLCRKGVQLRRFIMFNDCLLHCSMTSSNFLKVHHELPLSAMKVKMPVQDEYRNEFSIISVTRSFNLIATSTEERDKWYQTLDAAIEDATIRRRTFAQAKFHQQNAVLVESPSNDALGKKAPVWVPDSRVTMCQSCLREFTLTFRRHHCRACGKVVCALCSANRAPLQYQKYEAMRVCDECFNVLQKEIDEKASCNGDDDKLDWSVDGDGCRKGIPSPSLQDLKAQFKKLHVSSTAQQKPYLPSVLKEVCANDAGSSMSGYLFVKTKRVWKKQWFVVKDKVLYSYKASEDVAALNTTPLLGFEVVTFNKAQDGIHHQLLFELRHAGHPKMQFYAQSLKSATRWIEAIRRATVLE